MKRAILALALSLSACGPETPANPAAGRWTVDAGWVCSGALILRDDGSTPFEVATGATQLGVAGSYSCADGQAGAVSGVVTTAGDFALQFTPAIEAGPALRTDRIEGTLTGDEIRAAFVSGLTWLLPPFRAVRER